MFLACCSTYQLHCHILLTLDIDRDVDVINHVRSFCSDRHKRQKVRMAIEKRATIVVSNNCHHSYCVKSRFSICNCTNHTFRLEYCNYLIQYNAFQDITKLQRVQNCLARVVTRSSHFTHFISLLKSVRYCIICKMCTYYCQSSVCVVIKQGLYLGLKANTGVQFDVLVCIIYVRASIHTPHIIKQCFSVRICSGLLSHLLVYSPASPLVLQISHSEILNLIKRSRWDSL